MSSHRCRNCEPVPEEVRRAADLLERRWTVSILWAAHTGAVRFNEFRQSLGSVPPRTLAQRLTDLEQAGLIERIVIDARPPRVEYRLTEAGLKIRGLLDAVRGWALTRT
jgi:DNA-binding HxlR family transcriptional regulator